MPGCGWGPGAPADGERGTLGSDPRDPGSLWAEGAEWQVGEAKGRGDGRGRGVAYAGPAGAGATDSWEEGSLAESDLSENFPQN